MHEHPDVGEWDVGLPQCINHLGISQLTRRVVAVARNRVDRSRSEQALGRIRSEPFCRETRAFRELTDRHEVVHKMKHGLCPMVRVKLLVENLPVEGRLSNGTSLAAGGLRSLSSTAT